MSRTLERSGGNACVVYMFALPGLAPSLPGLVDGWEPVGTGSALFLLIFFFFAILQFRLL